MPGTGNLWLVQSNRELSRGAPGGTCARGPVASRRGRIFLWAGQLAPSVKRGAVATPWTAGRLPGDNRVWGRLAQAARPGAGPWWKLRGDAPAQGHATEDRRGLVAHPGSRPKVGLSARRAAERPGFLFFQVGAHTLRCSFKHPSTPGQPSRKCRPLSPTQKQWLHGGGPSGGPPFTHAVGGLLGHTRSLLPSSGPSVRRGLPGTRQGLGKEWPGLLTPGGLCGRVAHPSPPPRPLVPNPALIEPLHG